MDLIFTPDAENDLQDSYQWYEHQRNELGEDFLSCVDVLIKQIIAMPESCPIVYKEFRRGLVRRFPYALFYEIDEKKIIVYAVFHSSQNPIKWKERRSES